MKRILVTVAALATAGTAMAADLGGPAYRGSLKDEAVGARFSWTGLYAGAHVGYGWGTADHNQTNGGMDPSTFSYDVDGVMAGLTLGYNRQFDMIVAGIEAEGGYMGVDGEGKIPSSVPGKFQALDVDGGAYALIAGRLGVAFDRTLVYAKAGYAYLDGDAGQKTTNPGYKTVRSDSFEGPVYGAGVEHFLTPNITIKAEWLRFDFDTVKGSQVSVSDAPIGFVYTNKTDVEIDTVKVGINYKFN